MLFWFDFHYSVECNWNYLNGISLSWDATIFYSDNNNYITRRRSWQTDIINDVTTIFRDYLYSLKRSDNESNKVFRNIRINVFVFSPIGENYLMCPKCYVTLHWLIQIRNLDIILKLPVVHHMIIRDKIFIHFLIFVSCIFCTNNYEYKSWGGPNILNSNFCWCISPTAHQGFVPWQFEGNKNLNEILSFEY